MKKDYYELVPFLQDYRSAH